MKKKFIFISFMTILIAMLTGCCYASDSKIETKSNIKELNDGRIQFEISLLKIEDIGEGINAYSCELNFNPNQLELVEVESYNSWNTPIFNKDKSKNGNTKIVATSNKFIKNKGTIFIATFNKKTKDKIDEISIKNFEVAAKINGKIIKISEEKLTPKNQKIDVSKTGVTEKTIKQNAKVWKILGIVVASILLIIGLLLVGFGIYRKNKGEKKE